jgi:hypothetical protein
MNTQQKTSKMYPVSGHLNPVQNVPYYGQITPVYTVMNEQQLYQYQMYQQMIIQQQAQQTAIVTHNSPQSKHKTVPVRILQRVKNDESSDVKNQFNPPPSTTPPPPSPSISKKLEQEQFEAKIQAEFQQFLADRTMKDKIERERIEQEERKKNELIIIMQELSSLKITFGNIFDTVQKLSISVFHFNLLKMFLRNIRDLGIDDNLFSSGEEKTTNECIVLFQLKNSRHFIHFNVFILGKKLLLKIKEFNESDCESIFDIDNEFFFNIDLLNAIIGFRLSVWIDKLVNRKIISASNMTLPSYIKFD